MVEPSHSCLTVCNTYCTSLRPRRRAPSFVVFAKVTSTALSAPSLPRPHIQTTLLAAGLLVLRRRPLSFAESIMTTSMFLPFVLLAGIATFPHQLRRCLFLHSLSSALLLVAVTPPTHYAPPSALSRSVSIVVCTLVI